MKRYILGITALVSSFMLYQFDARADQYQGISASPREPIPKRDTIYTERAMKDDYLFDEMIEILGDDLSTKGSTRQKNRFKKRS